MKEVLATTFDEIIDEFRKYPKQNLLPADMPFKLRAGWRIEKPAVVVTIKIANIRRWSPELLDLFRDEGGRERMRKLIEKRAWPE